MGIIKVLDKNTVNKIAAGEVIENPAAVVKELVENSIDAESNSITVEIKDGGSGLIRVTDNGKGIDRDDIVTAFLPHATSKILTAEDLISVRSLGFRGEALASIASIAKVEVLSKTAGSLVGTLYEIHGGEEIELKEIGIPEGTTFVVRDLFYNTPARQKFLKSSATEGRYVLEVMERIALSHPHIAFKFITNGQLKFQTVGNGSLKDVIFYMYGKDVSANTFSLDVYERKEGYEISGFIGKPALTRGNREYESYFLNGRYIKSKVITKAIEEAYKPFIMGGKFPFTCLMLSIRHELVDVNVHPAKLEVRFQESEEVYHLVYHAITEKLKNRELIPDVSLEIKPEKSPMIRDFKKDFTIPDIPMPEPFESERAREWKKEIKPLFQQESFLAEKWEYCPKEKRKSEEIEEGKEQIKEILEETKAASEINGCAFDEKTESNFSSVSFSHFSEPKLSVVEKNSTVIEKERYNLMTEKILPDIKFIGQVFGTYWIVQYGDNVYMIDQHAAHEKVMFERFLEKFKNESIISQNLLPPAIVSLSASQIMAFEELREDIERLGFEVEEFGGNEYAIKAVPTELFGLSEKEAFIEILDEKSIGFKKRLTDNTLDKLATRACKAAIKGNNSLSKEEAMQLIKDLMTLENPYNCPHGRPTMIFMSKAEIEKKFKRQI